MQAGVGECSYSLSMILGHPATHYCMKSDEPRTHHAVQPASQPAWPACGCMRSARLHAGAANQRRAKSLKQASQCSVLQLQRSRAARNRVVGHSQQAFLRRWWRHKSEALVRVWRRAKRTGSRLDGHHRAQISLIRVARSAHLFHVASIAFRIAKNRRASCRKIVRRDASLRVDLVGRLELSTGVTQLRLKTIPWLSRATPNSRVMA